MRVGLVRRGFSETGGAEAYLLRLAEGLNAAGHEPALVTSDAWPQQAWRHGPITRLAGHTPTAFARDFLSVKSDFDVTLSLDRTPGCDVFRAGDGVHAAWLSRRSRFEPGWKSFLRRWNPKHAALVILEREVFLRTSLIIANSQMVAGEITTHYGVPSNRLRVIYTGIGKGMPAGNREEARQKCGVQEGVFCVLFAGTGWERKGLKFAVEAVDALPFESVLLVAGRGKPRAYAGRRTRFLGPTRDLPSIFAAADVFLLPTLYDPFSNACLEAASAGLPVVTTTANGFSEVIQPGIHGHAVEPGEVKALTEALDFWRGKNRAETICVCRELSEKYTLELNVSQTVEALQDARPTLL